MTQQTPVKPLDLADLIDRAARGAGRVHAQGGWGVLRVSEEEIEAMALVLVMLGYPTIHPGETVSDADRAFVWTQALARFNASPILPIDSPVKEVA
ncbi:MAG: hypothetical protein AAGP08_00180 [Pseudomonadota bacterium]